jgi:hypothetical protein
VTFDVRANDTDADGDPLTVTITSGPAHGTTVVNANGTITYTPASNYNGTDSLTYSVSDGQGGTASASVSISVTPVNDPPSANAGGPYTVAEGATVTVTGSGSDIDSAGVTYAWDLDNDGVFETAGQTAVFSAAGLNGPSTRTIRLRVTDTEGLSTIATATVNIVNAPPTVGSISWNASVEPLKVNTSVTGSATVADPGGDSLSAIWNWGDNTTSAGTISGGSVTAAHSYTAAGMYTVTLTVSDGDGGSTQVLFKYVDVYNPNTGAGYVMSSGGTFNSATAGYYTVNPAWTGTVSITSLGSRYSTSTSTTPTGSTRFSLSGANMSFSSAANTWLVVVGSTAWNRGTGNVTINGVVESCEFLWSVVDGSPDKIRLKLWNAKRGVIYDNMPGAPDNAVATTPVTSTSGTVQIIH